MTITAQSLRPPHNPRLVPSAKHRGAYSFYASLHFAAQDKGKVKSWLLLDVISLDVRVGIAWKTYMKNDSTTALFLWDVGVVHFGDKPPGAHCTISGFAFSPRGAMSVKSVMPQIRAFVPTQWLAV